MYKISVPIMLSTLNRSGGHSRVLSDLKKLGTERVFLALDQIDTNTKNRTELLALLKDECAFFKANGFEVGAWLWTFMFRGKDNFTRMTAASGEEHPTVACPLDEDFKALMCGYIKDIAKTGVDIILFDDDFRYGFLINSGIVCTCKLHMNKICDILGEQITPAELQARAISGEKNKYRDAWLKVNGDALREYARAMRDALDEISPDTRLGLCSCMSAWDNDGVDGQTLCRILAGKTKPFLRLIGAAYWAAFKSWGNRLQNVVELERMERSWCDDDIEIIAEGDAWPRPRTNCPAAYLELFDMAMRVDGSVDGILKYPIDYVSSFDYETGYVARHIRNAPIYKGIHEIFDGKTACGVRIYEAMNKLSDMKIPKEVENSGKIEDIFFSPAARFLSDNSIPSVYEGQGVCGMAFGENIKYVPQNALSNGMIIDLRAAEILAERGIDTGILSVGNTVRVSEEHFITQHEYTNICFGANVPIVSVSPKAVICSAFITDGGEIPSAYFYENKNGQKFFVFTFNAYFCSEYLYRSYARSRQLTNAVKVLTGNDLPAYTSGNPDLYLIAKKGDNSMSVGLFNIFPDTAFEPQIQLDSEYVSIKTVNCTGKIEGKTVTLSDIPPFAFAGFEITK